MSRSLPTATRRGNCYVCVEALYHLLGGKEAGLTPHRLRYEGDTHWYLVLDSGSPGIAPHVLDPTVSQFETPPDYSKGIGSGFLTKGPSVRAQELMRRMVWQEQ